MNGEKILTKVATGHTNEQWQEIDSRKVEKLKPKIKEGVDILASHGERTRSLKKAIDQWLKNGAHENRWDSTLSRQEVKNVGTMLVARVVELVSGVAGVAVGVDKLTDLASTLGYAPTDQNLPAYLNFVEHTIPNEVAADTVQLFHLITLLLEKVWPAELVFQINNAIEATIESIKSGSLATKALILLPTFVLAKYIRNRMARRLLLPESDKVIIQEIERKNGDLQREIETLYQQILMEVKREAERRKELTKIRNPRNSRQSNRRARFKRNQSRRSRPKNKDSESTPNDAEWQKKMAKIKMETEYRDILLNIKAQAEQLLEVVKELKMVSGLERNIQQTIEQCDNFLS